MKKAKLPSLVTILILTLITVVVWVTFDVYRLFNKQADPVVPESVSLPLTPTFDTEVINLIESRIFLDSSQIPNQVIGNEVVTLENMPVSDNNESTIDAPTDSSVDASTENP